MSNTKEKKKINVEAVLEDAWVWWQYLQHFEQEYLVLKMYMQKFKIKEEDVDFA